MDAKNLDFLKHSFLTYNLKSHSWYGILLCYHFYSRDIVTTSAYRCQTNHCFHLFMTPKFWLNELQWLTPLHKLQVHHGKRTRPSLSRPFLADSSDVWSSQGSLVAVRTRTFVEDCAFAEDYFSTVSRCCRARELGFEGSGELNGLPSVFKGKQRSFLRRGRRHTIQYTVVSEFFSKEKGHLMKKYRTL